MNDKDKKVMADMITQAITKRKKEKYWFTKIGIIPKILTEIVVCGISVSEIGTGVSWFL